VLGIRPRRQIGAAFANQFEHQRGPEPVSLREVDTKHRIQKSPVHQRREHWPNCLGAARGVIGRPVFPMRSAAEPIPARFESHSATLAW
jgi:hypothetical protein